MPQNEQTPGVSTLLSTVSEYLKLLLEDTRLNFAEKLTRILSASALFLLLTIVATVALVFLSIAVSIALSVAISPLWAFVIVAGFYVLVLVLLVTCRRTFIVNPIARFISTILLDEPVENQTPASND